MPAGERCRIPAGLFHTSSVAGRSDLMRRRERMEALLANGEFDWRTLAHIYMEGQTRASKTKPGSSLFGMYCSSCSRGLAPVASLNNACARLQVFQALAVRQFFQFPCAQRLRADKRQPPRCDMDQSGKSEKEMAP
jgi:hypothetical protein